MQTGKVSQWQVGLSHGSKAYTLIQGCRRIVSRNAAGDVRSIDQGQASILREYVAHSWAIKSICVEVYSYRRARLESVTVGSLGHAVQSMQHRHRRAICCEFCVVAFFSVIWPTQMRELHAFCRCRCLIRRSQYIQHRNLQKRSAAIRSKIRLKHASYDT